MKLIGATILCLVATTASAQLHLTIAVDPSAILPGLVPSLRIEVRNTGSSEAELPAPAGLLITVPGQEPFRASATGVGRPMTEEFPGDSPMIPAGETRDLTMWTAGHSVPARFVYDDRLAVPGTYRLRLIAGVDRDPMSESGHAVRTTPAPDPITSNEVTYTVLVPQGEDAAVWQRIRSLKTPSSWPIALAEEIWRDFPDSRYAAYCVPQVEPSDPVKEIALYEKVLARDPDPVTADAYRETLAHLHLSRQHRALVARDLAAAIDATEDARKLLTRLAREAIDPDTRTTAATRLETLQSREDLVRTIDALQGRYPTEITTGVVCVEKLADGSSVIWFGYDNPSMKTLTEPIGPRNKFTPPPFDRGQPTTFEPVVNQLAFSLPATIPELTWHLQKTQLVVKPRNVPACDPNDLARYRELNPPKP